MNRASPKSPTQKRKDENGKMKTNQAQQTVGYEESL
jgi:hypothetical protein